MDKLLYDYFYEVFQTSATFPVTHISSVIDTWASSLEQETEISVYLFLLFDILELITLGIEKKKQKNVFPIIFHFVLGWVLRAVNMAILCAYYAFCFSTSRRVVVDIDNRM